jgi:glutathione synthase/RimK-type ligase-like ATP-grasp enzyme
MPILVVVDKPEDWPLDVPGVEVVPARRYLSDPTWSARRGVKVFNLCRRYRYQSRGYYVSLLAQGRGHRPIPSVATLQDLRNPSLLKLISGDVEDEIERSLSPIIGDQFTLSIYFGRNLARRHQRLSLELFNLFPAPLLRATFSRDSAGAWALRSLRPIAAREIPPSHQEFVVEAAREHFARRHRPGARAGQGRFDLAILVNPEEREPPSDERAIRRFVRAAAHVGFDVEIIGPEGYGRLAEFDALFIRETTRVEHHTYRFARRAAAEGLAVIDDPESIVRCTNKVYLAEALARARIPTPRTVVVDRESLGEVARAMPYPCILKRPDGTFSQGVVRAESPAELASRARELFEGSELLIVQEFLPTELDWRVGVLDGEPLFAAIYRMARNHWQIIQRDAAGEVVRHGRVSAVPLDQVPPRALEAAVAAARLMGEGLYGVDLKERNGECFVIEVNDNPNIDADLEDKVLGEELYRRILQSLMTRVEGRKGLLAAR